MLLLYPVSAFRKVGNYRKKNGKCPDVFEHFQKSPSTQPVRQPSTGPLQPMQRNKNGLPGFATIVRPRIGTFSLCVNEHFGNLNDLRGRVKPASLPVLSVSGQSVASRSEEHTSELQFSVSVVSQLP